MVKIIALSRGKDRNVRSIEATFSKDGNLVPLRVNEDDRPGVFNDINKLLANQAPGSDITETARELFNLMSPEAKFQEQISSSYYLSGSLSIRDGHIFFGENRLEDALATHMMSLLDDTNAPKDEKQWRSYVKFLDNLHQNADEDIRKQLFRWMEYENESGNGFGITEDGCLVGYKGCGGTILEPMSVFTGNAIVDGEEFDGNIPNKAGSVIQMPRSAVQNDPSVGCSFGLHVGTRDYAVQWAPVLLLVKVNPRDVVSVPYECESQKMRVCEYTVIKVTDASDEHKMFHPDPEEYDEDNNDDELTSHEAYGLLGKELYVEYDDGNSTFEGKLIDVYAEGSTAIVLEADDGEYEDIELHRISYYEVLHNEDPEDPEDPKDEFVMTPEDAVDLLSNDERIFVDYDGKSFSGVVVDVYIAPRKDPGVIIKDDDGEYKHIKLHRIEDWGKQSLNTGNDSNTKEEDDEDFYEDTEDELHNLIDSIFGKLTECGILQENTRDSEENEDFDVSSYKSIYELPIGASVVAVYKEGCQLAVFQGTVNSVSKSDMELTVENGEDGKLTISFTDIVSLQRL